MTYDLRDYWPQPETGKQLLAQFYYANGGAESQSVLRRYVRRGTVGDQAVIRLDEYAPAWVDAWEYLDDGTQILEVGTWQSASHKVYKPGKEIQWGGAQENGNVAARQIEVDLPASTGVTPGYWNYGHQKLTFEDFLSSFTNVAGVTFSDVVRVMVSQNWCANGGCFFPDGQNITKLKYWLAPGLGAIQIEYITPIARIDYVKSVPLETWETA